MFHKISNETRRIYGLITATASFFLVTIPLFFVVPEFLNAQEGCLVLAMFLIGVSVGLLFINGDD